ncbi:MAG: DNA cytosine methyltransferase [Syntrophobacteraceae bacterium]
MEPTFVSLFSGCGGFDLGFTEAGFRCLTAVDVEPAAARVHVKNFQASFLLHDLSSKTLPGLSVRPDVLIAGPPCQGFSTAGKREFDDPRNELLRTAGELALALKPKVFVLENVRGVISGSHKQYWDRLKHTLKDKYEVEELCCLGTEMGVPQIRKRMVLLAWERGREVRIEIQKLEAGDLRSALLGVENVPDHIPKFLPPNSKLLLIAKKIKQGQKLSNVRGGTNAIPTWEIPEVFGQVTNGEKRCLEALRAARRRFRLRPFGDADPVGLELISEVAGYDVSKEIASLLEKHYVRKMNGALDLTHTFNGKFRRLHWDRPSLTVDTRFGSPRYFLHPEQHRGFTSREAARIQGFPDSFVFEGSDSERFRLIGNAVPPPLAKLIATFIRDAFLM